MFRIFIFSIIEKKEYHSRSEIVNLPDPLVTFLEADAKPLKKDKAKKALVPKSIFSKSEQCCQMRHPD